MSALSLEVLAGYGSAHGFAISFVAFFSLLGALLPGLLAAGSMTFRLSHARN